MAINGPGDLKLKSKLVGPTMRLKPSFAPLEGVLVSSIFNYQDLLYCGRNLENAESIRTLYSLHALNHVLK
jgi:U3 small nucleolar RNA-associated protein 25